MISRRWRGKRRRRLDYPNNATLVRVRVHVKYVHHNLLWNHRLWRAQRERERERERERLDIFRGLF